MQSFLEVQLWPCNLCIICQNSSMTNAMILVTTCPSDFPYSEMVTLLIKSLFRAPNSLMETQSVTLGSSVPLPCIPCYYAIDRHAIDVPTMQDCIAVHSRHINGKAFYLCLYFLLVGCQAVFNVCPIVLIGCI